MPADTSIKTAMQSLGETLERILFVVAENNELLGTINDGDIRRALIKGHKFADSVAPIMNKDFFAVSNQVLNIKSYAKK